MALRQVTLADHPPGQPVLHSEHPLLRSMRVRGYYLAERHDPTWTNTGAFPVNWARGHGLATDGSTATNAPRLYRAESIATGAKIVVLLAFVPQNTSDTSRYIWHANNSTTSTALANRTWGIGQHNGTVTFYARDLPRVSSGSVLVPGVPVVAAGSYDVGAGIEACHIDGEATLGSYVNTYNTQAYVNLGGGDAGGSTARVLWAIWGDMDGTSTSRSEWCQRASGYFRHNLRDVYRPQRIWVPVSAGGGGAVSLTLADATHGHAADGIGLTSQTLLAHADALHAHAAESIALSTAAALALADAAHSHTADAITLSTASALALADATHGHAADDLTLDVAGATTLALADALHAHAADAPALSVLSVLSVADALHGHGADGLTLTTASQLALADALHAHAAENVTLSDAPALLIADGLQAHTSDGMVLTVDAWLVLADALHGHTADNVVLVLPGATTVREVRLLLSAIARTAGGSSAIVPASDGSSATARTVTLTSRIDAEGTP